MGDGGAVLLREMSDARYEEYLGILIPDYAAEGSRASGMAMEQALEFAKNQIGEILPDGPGTEGQFLFDVVDDEGRVAGLVWIALQSDRDPVRAFIYDIRIDEERRGEGLGTAAMLRVEEKARELGAGEVGLHVFTHNEGAVRLYDRLGYRVVKDGGGGMQMAKEV
jgi:ribosomal protein S18 acetylase RimI-like enzyme